MSKVPNFATVDFADTPVAERRRRGRALDDAGSHPGEAGLWRGRSRRHRLPRHLSRQGALSARALPGDVRGAALDHPAICRLLDGGRFQRLLPAQSRRRPEGPVDRLRSRHPSRLRLGSSARLRRCRHGRRRHRFHLRHAHAVFRHSARQDERVDDHERRGAAGAGALYRRRRGTGRAARQTVGHDPERHPQRIHGAQHLYLSARPVLAHHLRHLRLHLGRDAEVQFDFGLRLSHAGSRRDAGPRTRLYARRRRRICPRRHQGRADHRSVRAARVVLLGDRHELLHGDRQAARRPHDLGQADEAVQARRSALAVACARIRRPRAGRWPRRTCSTMSRAP